MRTLRTLLLLALAAGCGKQTFLAATFVQTPPMANPQDASKPIPSFQLVTAYFGTIDVTNPTSIDPTNLGTIPNASAKLAFRHQPASGPASDVVLALNSSGNGSYTLSSNDDPNLTFEQTPYTLVFVAPGGEAFGARMTPGPAVSLKEFGASTCTTGYTTPVANCIELAANSVLHVTRNDASAGSSRPPAFVLVQQVNTSNPSATPAFTYKTIPADGVSLLKYVISDADYRWDAADLPASAFPQAGVYLVTLLTATNGSVSDNAFFGSAAIAAGGWGGLVVAH